MRWLCDRWFWIRWFSLALALLAGAAPRSAAQFIGFTSPQTVTSNPFPANTVCTGSAQTALIQNLGQNEHQALFLDEGGITSATMQLQGSNDGVNFVNISDPATGITPTAISAQGYYNVVRVSVTCTVGGTFTVQYSGTSGTPGDPQGTIKSSFLDKGIFNGVTAGSAFTSISQVTPFGNSSGLLYFQFVGGTGPVGSTIDVHCGSTNINGGLDYVFTMANTTSPQTFTVPANPCTFFSVIYTAGGASANTMVLDYAFAVPGSQISNGSVGANVNLTQVGGGTIAIGQATMSNSLPVVVASNQSAIPVSISAPVGQHAMAASIPIVVASDQSAIPVTFASPVLNDPCQGSTLTKSSVFKNISTATTTALVAVSGSTTVYVCEVDLDITSSTASTVLLEQGTGSACAGSPTALTPTYTNSTLVNAFKQISGPGMLFATSASNGLCAVSTVGTGPAIGVHVTYVQQ